MVCRRTCWGRYSRCRTLPLVYLLTHGAVTTSFPCCGNFIGCRSRDEWSLKLHVLYTNRSLQRRRSICLQTFILPPSMVAISAHLHIDHCLLHGLEPPSVTEVSLSQDRAFGTVCWLLSDRSPATDSLLSLGDIWKHIYLGHRKPRRIVTFIFHALYKYTYLLTYLLTIPTAKHMTYFITDYLLPAHIIAVLSDAQGTKCTRWKLSTKETKCASIGVVYLNSSNSL